MNNTVIGLLVSGFLAAPFAAQAQTLKFYSGVSGTSMSLLRDTVGIPDDLPLTAFPFSGFVTGSITLDGSASITFDFSLGEQGNGGPGIDAINAFSLSGEFYSCGGGSYCSEWGNIQILTDARGVITGATVNLAPAIYNGPSSQLIISQTDVEGNYDGTIPAEPEYGCWDAAVSYIGPNGKGIYTGPTIKNCTVTVNSSQPGRWIVDRSAADQ
jgi:hypothetical protein